MMISKKFHFLYARCCVIILLFRFFLNTLAQTDRLLKLGISQSIPHHQGIDIVATENFYLKIKKSYI